MKKEIDQLRNSARMSTTNGKNVDNQSKNVAVGGPKPEIKKMKAEELGSPIETWPKNNRTNKTRRKNLFIIGSINFNDQPNKRYDSWY